MRFYYVFVGLRSEEQQFMLTDSEFELSLYSSLKDTIIRVMKLPKRICQDDIDFHYFMPDAWLVTPQDISPYAAGRETAFRAAIRKLTDMGVPHPEAYDSPVFDNWDSHLFLMILEARSGD